MVRLFSLYFVTEIIKTFFLGVFIFISIITMLQFLQISELIIIHGLTFIQTLNILMNMSISFLPTVFPMSLLFAVLLTYSRMSADSEIVALQALGYAPFQLIMPAIVFSAILFVVSYQTLDAVGPISRKKFDDNIQLVQGQKIIESLVERTFVENFFNLVLYFNEKVDKTKMKDLFIRDQRDPQHPRTILAKYGTITAGRKDLNQVAKIDLQDGKMFEQNSESGIAIKFESYSLEVLSPISVRKEDRDLNTYINKELLSLQNDSRLSENKRFEVGVELHRRLSTAFSCFIFGLLGAVLGMSTNRRSGSSRGFILSVICMGTYWLMIAAFSSVASHPSVRSVYMLWIPNLIFLGVAALFYKKTSMAG